MAITLGSRAPRLLVVDDEPAILDLLQRRLEALGCSVSLLSGGSRVVQTAREQTPDLILMDVMMPDLDGFTVCQALKQDPAIRDIPVIMMTARSEIDSRIKGLELGAHDYVAKPFETAEVVARIRAALRVKQLQDELKEANKKLERLATSDSLTDLPNRRMFSVLMIDLDHFKKINDTYGHQIGDEALRQLGRLLNGRRRATDLVGRYGGEEFVWVLPAAKTEDAMEIAEWLRRAVEDMSVEMVEGRVGLTVSVGVTTYEPVAHGPISADTMLGAADQALREAKAAGRNRVTYRILGLTEPAMSEEQEPEVPEDEEAPGATRYR
jgi:diguanylate cyclase (GGDEF)-like protein